MYLEKDLVCKICLLPRKYLGLPLDINQKRYGTRFWRRWNEDQLDGEALFIKGREKPNGFLIDDSDDIDRDLDTELELLTMMNVLTMDMMNALTMDMLSEIDRFYITLQFKLAKAMSPCIIGISNIFL